MMHLFSNLSEISWVYVVGGIGMLAEWRAYSVVQQQAFRRWSAAAALLWALQYCLLEASTAAVTMAVTALRTACSGWLTPANRVTRHLQALIFVLLFCSLTLISWQNYASLLPGFAVINTTLALYYLRNRSMRFALLVSSIAWLSNDWYWQAWSALAAESIAVLINLRTIAKLSAAERACIG